MGSVRLEWLKRRQSSIGASEAPVLVLGKVFRKTPMDVFAAKKRIITEDDVTENENSPDLKRGNLYEVIAAQRYRDHLAKEAPDVVFHFPDGMDDHLADDRWFVRHPFNPHRTVNFDGLRDDGWVVEIKSPRQFVCDKIKSEGIKDYHQIQALFQAGIAFDCGTSVFGPGICKGTIVVVYEPETTEIQIYPIPIDLEFIEVINQTVDRFWRDHILADVPPVAWSKPANVPEGPKSKTNYIALDGEAWSEVERQFVSAKERKRIAEHLETSAKEHMKELLTEAGVTHALLPRGLKVQHGKQAGRKSLHVETLKAEHPEIDFNRYMVQGEDFEVLRTYAPKVQTDDTEEMSELAMAATISQELERFSKSRIGIEQASDVLDDMRLRAELHVRTLEIEADQLRAAIEAAEKSMIGRRA